MVAGENVVPWFSYQIGGVTKPYDGTCLLEPNPDGGPVEFTRGNEVVRPSCGDNYCRALYYSLT